MRRANSPFFFAEGAGRTGNKSDNGHQHGTSGTSLGHPKGGGCPTPNHHMWESATRNTPTYTVFWLLRYYWDIRDIKTKRLLGSKINIMEKDVPDVPDVPPLAYASPRVGGDRSGALDFARRKSGDITRRGQVATGKGQEGNPWPRDRFPFFAGRDSPSVGFPLLLVSR